MADGGQFQMAGGGQFTWVFHSYQLFHLKELENISLTEKEFAQLIGRCKMYQYLPPALKAGIPSLSFGDSQINTICKEYFRDTHFGGNKEDGINLWKLYNLFTGSNKSSYIDTFLDKSVNAFDFIKTIRNAKQDNTFNWFLQ